MNAITPQQQLNFLLEVLKAIYKSGGDRSIACGLLQANPDLLNDRLAELLRSWATHRFTTVKPTTAITLAQTVVRFGQLLEQFPVGNPMTNWTIAIAGYEMGLLVFTESLYPQKFADIQAALAATKQQQQKALEREATESSVTRMTREIDVIQATLKALTAQVDSLKPAQNPMDFAPLISAIRELHAPPNPSTNLGIKLPPEEFNAAIFYDIENLTKGYKFDRKLISKISLGTLINKIREQHQFGKIAIHRAYANWSIPQIKNMKHELLALGIEPIQVFGFGLYSQKNAADIQLTIDAIEFVHNKPAIQLFIIVSGDGAFASVANKLHEYGKKVIGCAYERATNYFIEAVCDAFIYIPDPEIKPHYTKLPIPNSTDKIIARARTTLQWLDGHQEYGKQLRDEGMYLSEVAKIFQQKLKSFNHKSLGFEKWKSCLEYICEGTDFCLISKSETDPRLILKETIISSTNPADRYSIQNDNHSLTKYRKILSAGYPIFRMPPPEDLIKVASSLARHPFVGEKIGDGIEKITKHLELKVSQQSVKKSLLVFISAGCFVTEPEGANLPNLSLTLKSEFDSQTAILKAIKYRARQKLQEQIQEVDDKILQQIIPAA